MIWAVEEVAKTTRAVAKGSREIILMLMMCTLFGIDWVSVSGAEENRTGAVGGDRETRVGLVLVSSERQQAGAALGFKISVAST